MIKKESSFYLDCMRSIWVIKYTCSKCSKTNQIRKSFSQKEYLITNNNNRCILHCQKDDWYEIRNNNVKSWDDSKDKIIFFWKTLDKYIKKSKEICFLEDIIFPVFFIETTFTYNYVIKKDISIHNCTFLDEIIFQNNTFEGRLSFMNLNFTDEFVFDYCNFNKEVSCILNLKKLKNIKLSFENSKFNEKFLMSDLDFSDCKVSFKNTMFNNLVDFHNTKFNDVTVFIDCVFQKPLDLRNTILKGEVNFLDIKFTELSNQETARLIKHQFEKLNNKIEANKYHALELDQRKRELEKDKCGNFAEYLVFKIHDISSKHSTSYFRATLGIVFIGFFTIFLVHFDIVKDLFLHPSNFKTEYLSKIWNEFWQYINITNLEKLKDKPFIFFLNKVSLGYLYYQFLTAVRKDTRK